MRRLTDAALHAELATLVAPAEAFYLNVRLESDLAELDDEEAWELLE